ncbi:MAG: alpha-1,6-glucosidase domain-containing protein [Pseudomonadota bacterium]
MSRTFTSALLISLAVLLSACGGGAPASAVPTPTPTPVPVPVTPPVAAATLRLHFHRTQGDTAGWGVYAWEGPKTPSAAWITDRFLFDKTDAFGAYVDVPLAGAATVFKFLVTDGSGNKNCGSDQILTLAASAATSGQEVWLAQADCTLYDKLPVISAARLDEAATYWLDAGTLAWPGAPASGANYRLYYAANGGIAGGATAITGADGSYALGVAGAVLSPALAARFPHLAGALALSLASADAANAKARLKGQLVLAQFDSAGKLVQASSVQTAGVLDDLYAGAAANVRLGPSFDSAGVPSVRVWAPTAKSVRLNLYGTANSSVDMQEDSASGVWSYTAPSAALANSAYYTFSVTVFSRWAANQLVTNEVSDPYSVSLNANGQRSLLANLASSVTKPAGWDGHAIPPLAHPTDIAIYELHLRDFSASDASVPAAHRGKYLAFTDSASNGMGHLKLLQKAGMSHIHLLPTADMSSVDETGCVAPAIPAAASDSPLQQAAVAATKERDCFNWGYDPEHYNAPEGSYASDAADGLVRIREYRAMVKALHDSGLRVAMDVVYNHTSAAKQADRSVLDKIVPGYYYRQSASGEITSDSCCADTAPENAMMGKLVLDSVKLWASQYQVDSFRFDIVGMLPLALMTRMQTEVDALGGRPIYLYGEAWNFGVVANDARFRQTRQANMAGTGIGSFNDRLRDAVRGGGCCDSGSAVISQQGFINGAWLDRNAASTQTLDDLLRMGDLIRVGLSASLKDYRQTDRFGASKLNAEIDYFGSGAGYTGAPQETINYIEVHDNQTLFDINVFKLPTATSIADRVRVQTMGNALVMLAQGIPLFQAGQDLLRSKSLDRDSYNAGDWFNALDFSYQSNNFGVGLPSAEKNQDSWSVMQPLLANPLLKPGNAQILAARNRFLELLAIRKDSTLFRLRTAQDVKDRLGFFNTGPTQVPGVVAMRIDGNGYAGANYASVVVLFNVDKVARTLTVDALKGKVLRLHPIQQASDDALPKQASYDSAAGSFSIPPRSTVVFVE